MRCTPSRGRSTAFPRASVAWRWRSGRPARSSREGSAPATVHRRLAALRAGLRVQVERGARAENPAELLGSPKRAHRLPRVLKVAEVEALLERIPALSPLELRDRAMFEVA